MKTFRALTLFALVAAGCGDNNLPDGPPTSSPSSFSSVGGSQVARSKSFTLVTSVSTSPQSVAKSKTHVLKSGLGE